MPLSVLATPIGNLGDLSPRSRQALQEADFIAAEDTRVTRKLLTALEIPAPELISYRGHDEARRAIPLVERLATGEKGVLVSDAGSPGVSDPGRFLVAACHAEGIPVHALAGPSAVAAAISVSGLPAVPFHFVGFSPRKPGPLRRWLVEQGQLPGAFVIYEAPSRTIATLEMIASLMPDRQVCLCRELTKLHEEVRLGSATELVAHLSEREKVRGEVALVVGPGEAPSLQTQQSEADAGSLKSVAAALAERWDVPRREAYQALLKLERELSGRG